MFEDVATSETGGAWRRGAVGRSPWRRATLLVTLGTAALAGCKYTAFEPVAPPLPTYTIQQLGLLPGGAQSEAIAASTAIIVGWATNAGGNHHAVIFTGGSAVALQEPSGAVSSEARAVNAAGMIVGFSTTAGGVQQALLWPSTTSAPVLLPSLGGAYSFADGINDQDIIVGDAQSDTGDTVLVVWQQGQTGTYLPAPVDSTGSGVDAVPTTINDNDEIAGNLGGGAGGLFWDVNDGWDTVSAPVSGTPVVNGLGSNGVVVGGVAGITPGQAFLFTTNLGSVTVGTPPTGYTTLEADAANAAGIIAGKASTVDGSGNTLTSVAAIIAFTNLTTAWTSLATLGGPLAQPADNGITACGVILGWATTTSAPAATLAVAWVPTGCTIP
jgi:probable HAF family extracellular repeat protein